MTAQTIEFRTEVKQLLDIVIHSLYSHKDIFLRELISNASDAIDKARFESLTNSEILETGEPWRIKISVDRGKRTVTVSDNGIGMTSEEAITALGTIAHSGTREFLKLLQSRDLSDSPELIGQFGVGFYSAFMVADRVSVISRRAGQKDRNGVKWESAADGTFSVDTIEKAGRGTDVIVHLRDGEETYMEEGRIRSIVRKYSDFIEHPIVMEVEKERESELKKGETYTVKEEETLNSMKALWLRDRSEVPDSDYDEFYRHLSHDVAAPARVIRFKAEGTTEFTALLFVPAHRPFDIFTAEFKIGPALYVRKVQIMDHCADLIPPYLRFVKGVVDSPDLPLNISREMLQSSHQVGVIRKSITKKILDTLAEMKKSEYEKYLSFYREFGAILKEGIHYDLSRRDAVAELLLFETSFSEPGQLITLGHYAGSMKEGQDAIYYILGPSRNEIVKSPHLEALREKGYDVLLMTDEIDPFIVAGLSEYKGVQL
ncbi:MAG: molecular chaperone HtpG, partial [Thermodesulfovibrionales bacterium]